MRSPIKLRSIARHGDTLPQDIPAAASARTEMFGAVKVAPFASDNTELFEIPGDQEPIELPEWMTPEPLPQRPSFLDRCQPSFAPAVSAGLRADFRDLPAFRDTVRAAGLAGLHLRATAGRRAERKLP